MAHPRGKTLKDLARAAGLSVSGASYAFRGHPSIPKATVERVRRLAAKIGYRPDLRISSLMAHIRRSQLPRDRENLAFVWVNVRKGERFARYHQHYLRMILTGARMRADQLGCGLSEFWLDEPGMTANRLSGILIARGITGIIFSPAMRDLAIELEWDWPAFACAVIGNTDWRPALHRAAHYHYRSMWQTLQRLRAEGCQRPAAVLSPVIHDRLHGAQLAAFRAGHPEPAAVDNLVQFATPEDLSLLRPWPRRTKPDALILGWPSYRETTAQTLARVGKAARTVTLDWQSDAGLPGVDICNEVIAANAVDLVVAQLHRNEQGVPIHPTQLLLDGVWREE
jgi:LacI family transcriptional regulator